jgi:hypothetical protein
MSTTGRFRNDLIAAAAGTARDVPPSSPVSTQAATPYANWLDRMQRTRGRHAAITKNLYTWSSYKNWADRVRDTWDEPDTKAEVAPTGNRRPR